jgi:hypothetical protein
MSRTSSAALVAAILLLRAGYAAAFDSGCARPNGDECTPGPDTAQNRWRSQRSEHLALWELTTATLGLPPHLTDTVNLEVFTTGFQVDPFAARLPATQANGHSPLKSLLPVSFAQTAVPARRSYTLAEMTQLPDHSYSLWDWASGNETCPIGGPTALPLTDAEHCHAFATHMGPLNSNHFLPQAQRFFHHYHGLALARARECAAMRSVLPEQFSSFADACDQEAFTYEAVGHHFLQDAFSMGHMWERWGGPDLDDFEGGPEAYASAVLVAMTSGFLHGARGVLQDELGFAADFTDAMCAPFNSSLVSDAAPVPGFPTYVDARGESVQGIGDLYLEEFQTGYRTQREAFLACARASLVELLASSGLPAVGAGNGPSPSESSFDARCFGQRANNWSMYWGFGLDYEAAGGPSHLYFGSVAGRLETVVLSVAKLLGAGISESLENRYRDDVAQNAAYMQMAAHAEPHGTELARGEMGSLLGALWNGAASYDRSPPASYADPSPPFRVTFDDVVGASAEQLTENVLARTFHRAHAQEWCETMTLADLSALKSDDEIKCGVICREFALRHVRVGKGEDDYDASQEPLCTYLASSPAYVYVDLEEGSSAANAATTFCCDSDHDGGAGGAGGMDGSGGSDTGNGGTHLGSGGTNSGSGATSSGGATSSAGGSTAAGGSDGTGGTGGTGGLETGGTGGDGAGGAQAGSSGAGGSSGRSGSGGSSGRGGGSGTGGIGGIPAEDGSYDDFDNEPDEEEACNSINPEACDRYRDTERSSHNQTTNQPQRSATANGDPNFHTFDGLAYGMQGVGEFVLLENGSDLLVQVRQEPATPSDRRVSSITALATRVGTKRIAFYAEEEPALWIDGEPVLLEERLEFPGGGHVVRERKTWELGFPNGDALLVRLVGFYTHLDVLYLKASTSPRALRGLLGTDDGLPDNDLTLRDGTPLLGRVDKDMLYGQFAASYRITQAESLFDYLPGMTTEDFTDLTFPDRVYSAASLSPGEYATAFAACSDHGVIVEGALGACILDYAVYGDLSAVRAYQGAPAAVSTLSLSAYANDFESQSTAGWIDVRLARTPEEAAIPLNHFAGPFTNEGVSFTLTQLPPHSAVTVSYDLYVFGPWSGQGYYSFSGNTTELVNVTFSNQAATQSFPGQRDVWAYPARTGAMAHDALAMPGFAVDSVYRMQHVFAHDGAQLSMGMTVGDLPAGSAFGFDNVEITLSPPVDWSEGEASDGTHVLSGPAGDPELIGCADGRREAFHELASYPYIAGCAATWSGTPNLRALATGVACGDGLGSCAVPADACAPGWRLCGSEGDVSELLQLTQLECRIRHDGRFVAATSSWVDETTCGSSSGSLEGYGCFDDGVSSDAVCCGDCGSTICHSAIWPSRGTPVVTGPCAAMPATGITGVLCCLP